MEALAINFPITFNYSLWLWGLPVVIAALIVGYIHLKAMRERANQAFVASHLQSILLQNISSWRRRIKESLIIIGFATIVIALARPQCGFNWQQIESKGLDLIFVLDTSKSMLAEDIKPNRLERAKLAIEDLLCKLNTDRLGLIIFTGRAFMLCPLTLDYEAFRMHLHAITIDTLPRGGTDLSAAINEGIAALPAKSSNKALILISDGEDLSGQGLAAALEAAQQGITIYTVGVGTQTGELIPLRDAQGNIDFVKDRQGKLVKSKLDSYDLEAIAHATEGIYAFLGSTGEGLEAIYNAMREKFPTMTQRTAMRKVPIEQFAWPVAIALIVWAIEPLISLRRARWRRLPRFQKSKKMLSIIAVLGLLCLLACPSIQAQMSVQRTALQPTAPPAPAPEPEAILPDELAYLSSEAAKHHEDLRYAYNFGTRAYELGKYSIASQALEAVTASTNIALQQKAFYNLGNTFYRQGQQLLIENPRKTLELWKQSLINFKSACELDPSDGNASYNRDFIEHKIKELEEELKKQNSPSKDENKQSNQDNPQSNDQANHEGQNSDQNQNNADKSQPENADKDQKDTNSSHNKPNSDNQESSDNSEDRQDENKSTSPSVVSSENSHKHNAENKPQPSAGSHGPSQPQEQSNNKPRNSEPNSDTGDQNTPPRSTPAHSSSNPAPSINPQAQRNLNSGNAQDSNIGQPQTVSASASQSQPFDSPTIAFGTMSLEEATQLLDSLKDNAQSLPVAGFGPNPQNAPQSSDNDW